jgi:hypothetical protein
VLNKYVSIQKGVEVVVMVARLDDVERRLGNWG